MTEDFSREELLRAQNKILSTRIIQLEQENFDVKKHRIQIQQQLKAAEGNFKKKHESLCKLAKIKTNFNNEEFPISSILDQRDLNGLKFIRDNFYSQFLLIDKSKVLSLLTTVDKELFLDFLELFFDWEIVFNHFFTYLSTDIKYKNFLVKNINFLPLNLIFTDQVVDFILQIQQEDPFAFEGLFIKTSLVSSKNLKKILLLKTFNKVLKCNRKHILIQNVLKMKNYDYINRTNYHFFK